MSFGKFRSGNNSKELLFNELLSKINKEKIPRHVAIIMDGNGRWAKLRGLPRVMGHRYGVEALREIIQTSSDLGIQYLTLYAFSTENWKRPASEVNALMNLLVEFLRKEIGELHQNGVKINVLGDITLLPDEARKEVLYSTDLTKNNTGLQVNIALNYGSRAEIIRGVKAIVKDCMEKNISVDDINEALFSQYLYTKGIPDPDLLIRTSGECRLSNFLLYQIAYTELYFTDASLLWPDFDKVSFIKVLLEYQRRDRRYGGISAGEEE